jgi:putative ABC transport system permease protein
MMRHALRQGLALLEEAFGALNANRLRSALTMLGVVIGVASVILMLAIGEGSRRRVASTIAGLGSNQLIVLSGSSRTDGMRGSAGSLPTLKLSDAQAIGGLVSVAAVAPVVNAQAQAIFGGANKNTTITGTTPAYFSVNNMKLAAGSAFTDIDVRTASNVAVVGATVAKELFGDEPPTGQTLRIQRQTFQVLGTLKAKGQGLGGTDQDDVILIPFTTAQRKLSGTVFPGTVSLIMVESRLPDEKGYTQEEITRLLRQRHHTAQAAADDFSVRDLSALTETLKLTSIVLSVLLGAIAFISLLVGGIGIMNIMLVSVTERTREIGVRLALGARRGSVLGQFLVEALLLSIFGALAGVALGFVAGWLASRTGAVTPVFSASAVALSVSVAIAVGVIFGFWPARRAALLQPVDALRYS